MIEYFDTYVRMDNGFVATKGEVVAICLKNASSVIRKERCTVRLYLNRQSPRSCMHVIDGYSVAGAMTHTVDFMIRHFLDERVAELKKSKEVEGDISSKDWRRGGVI